MLVWQVRIGHDRESSAGRTDTLETILECQSLGHEPSVVPFVLGNRWSHLSREEAGCRWHTKNVLPANDPDSTNWP